MVWYGGAGCGAQHPSFLTNWRARICDKSEHTVRCVAIRRHAANLCDADFLDGQRTLQDCALCLGDITWLRSRGRDHAARKLQPTLGCSFLAA